MTTNKQTWKQVSISGVTGILMGAGAMKAMQPTAAGESENNVGQAETAEAASQYDNLSFREAFDAARAEMGAGGVFRWHGNIYNTYTADEWNTMSAEEQDEFAEQVGAEISSEDVDTSDLAEAETEVETEVEAEVEVATDADSDVAIASGDTDDVNVVVDNDANAEPTEANEQTTESEDDDVRVLGFGDVTLNNGQTVTVEELEINGQRVAVIDIDQDGEADYAISDLNHNQQMDEGEVIDLHTGEAVSFTNDDVASVDMTADIQI